MTKGESKKLFLRWLDEATVNGQEAGTDITADLVNRFDHFLDGAVGYIAGLFKLSGVCQVVQQAIPAVSGIGFEMRRILPPDRFVMEADSAGSFYLEVQGTAEIRVESTGDAKTLQNTGAAFGAYRGNLAGVGGRVTVSGAYPFTVRNAGLFGCRFPTDEEVPDFVPWVPHPMPEDFREFDRITRQNGSEYTEVTEYRKEGDRVFCLPYSRCGAFDFHYWRNPKPLGVEAPDDAILDVDPKAAILVPLKVAVDLTAGTDETTYISDYLDRILSNMIVNMMSADTGGRRSVKTIFGQV